MSESLTSSEFYKVGSLIKTHIDISSENGAIPPETLIRVIEYKPAQNPIECFVKFRVVGSDKESSEVYMTTRKEVATKLS